MPRTTTVEPGALEGIRALDLGTVYAAPIAAMLLGDFGADVVKVEHPRGDSTRTHGHDKEGHGLWWKVISRNKRARAARDRRLRDGIEPLVLGGDHSITIPRTRTLDAVADRFGVVQLDAHLDLVDESPAQGRLSQGSPMRRTIELPGCAPERLIQIGLRSFNHPEYYDWCRGQGITQLPGGQALTLGSADVAEPALASSTSIIASSATSPWPGRASTSAPNQDSP